MQKNRKVSYENSGIKDNIMAPIWRESGWFSTVFCKKDPIVQEWCKFLKDEKTDTENLFDEHCKHIGWI